MDLTKLHALLLDTPVHASTPQPIYPNLCMIAAILCTLVHLASLLDQMKRTNLVSWWGLHGTTVI